MYLTCSLVKATRYITDIMANNTSQTNNSRVIDFHILPRHRNKSLNKVQGREVDTSKLY